MGESETTKITSRASVELLHAEVGYLLGQAGIPVLHIKGPTVARWLYPDGGRPWGDVDILVPPTLMADALAVLAEHGLVDRFPVLKPRTAADDHAVTLNWLDPDLGGDDVDVHDRFPGLEADPDRAFEVLWTRREPAELAHTAVWFPDLASRALLVVLNTARTRWSVQALADLDRVLVPSAQVDWPEVVTLALRLGAGPALRAGLELAEAGHKVVAGTELRHVPISAEWILRLAEGSHTALRLEKLIRLPARSWVASLGRWLFPAPGVLRRRDPRAAVGHRALVLAYLRRLGYGLRSLPPSVWELRRARRG